MKNKLSINNKLIYQNLLLFNLQKLKIIKNNLLALQGFYYIFLLLIIYLFFYLFHFYFNKNLLLKINIINRLIRR